MKGIEEGSLFVLGLDGGGSHTKCVILDGGGQEAGRGVGGASNHHSVGVEAARDAIVIAMENARKAAGNPMISAACWGIAGLDWPEDERIFKDMSQHLFPDIPAKVVHDATIALVGGTGGKHFGLVIISGTGSIAVGYHPSGKMERAGGWGHLIGDEGSGYHIALQGLNAASRAYDNREENTSLVEAFVQESGESSFEDLVNQIYLRKWSAPQIAMFAPIVLAEADAGDRVASQIVDQAGRELALAAKTVIDKLEMSNDVFDVILAGGIFVGSPTMVEIIGEELHSHTPSADVKLPLFEPVIGAGLMALDWARRNEGS